MVVFVISSVVVYVISGVVVYVISGVVVYVISGVVVYVISGVVVYVISGVVYVISGVGLWIVALRFVSQQVLPTFSHWLCLFYMLSLFRSFHNQLCLLTSLSPSFHFQIFSR